jgi:hypothetical protein
MDGPHRGEVESSDEGARDVVAPAERLHPPLTSGDRLLRIGAPVEGPCLEESAGIHGELRPPIWP